MDEMLTVKQAAETLGMAEGSVRTAILAGRLPASRIGERLLLIHRRDVDRYKRDYPRTRGRPSKTRPSDPRP
jgi:excisionase family DNA binding protein